MVVIATVDGLASNLALTVPLALIVLFGAFGSAAEHWLLPSGPRSAIARCPGDRERARRQRERIRAARREALSAHKEKGS